MSSPRALTIHRSSDDMVGGISLAQTLQKCQWLYAVTVGMVEGGGMKMIFLRIVQFRVSHARNASLSLLTKTAQQVGVNGMLEAVYASRLATASLPTERADQNAAHGARKAIRARSCVATQRQMRVQQMANALGAMAHATLTPRKHQRCNPRHSRPQHQQRRPRQQHQHQYKH